MRGLVGVDLTSIAGMDDVRETAQRIQDRLAANAGDSARNTHPG